MDPIRGAAPLRFGQPTGADLTVSMPLTNLSVAYAQEASAFIADRVFPTVRVVDQGGIYYVHERGNWFRPEAKVRAPATESVGSGWELSSQAYMAAVYAFHKDIADQDRARGRTFDQDQEATDFVTHQMLLTRELAWSQKYFAPGIWATERTGVAASPGATEFLQWNDPNSDPVRDIRALATQQARTTGFRPNKFVIGPEILDTIVQHPKIVELYKHTQPGVPDTDILAPLFKVDEVLVPEVIQNTAIEGAADAMGFVYGKSALLAYAAPRPGLKTPSAGYNFAWDGYLPGAGMGAVMSRFRMEQIKSTRVEAESAYDMRVVAAEMGTFLTSVVA